MDPYGLFTWNDPSTYPLLPRSFVNGSAGIGDVLLFGQGQRLRNLLGIGGINTCSSSYGVGTAVGIIGSLGDGEGEAQIIFKTAHYAPRLIGEAVDVASAETAVTREIQAILAQGKAVGPISGRIIVDDVLVQYNAFPLENGVMNLGTIYPVLW